MHKHRHRRRCHGLGRGRVPNAEQLLGRLEEYQRDLEQEVADGRLGTGDRPDFPPSRYPEE